MLVEEGLQGVEAGLPQASVWRKPRVEFDQTLGPQRVDAPLRVGMHMDEPRLAQDTQMLGCRRLRRLQRGGELADRPRGFEQQIEDPPARGLGEDREQLR